MGDHHVESWYNKPAGHDRVAAENLIQKVSGRLVSKLRHALL